MGEFSKGLSELLDEIQAWRDAAQSATPGGSEYTTPEACRAHIRMIKDDLHEARKETVRLRRALHQAQASK